MMLKAAVNAFKVPDLRRKILFTLAMLVAFRLVSHIPVPMVNAAAVGEILRSNAILNFLDFFSGGALVNFSVAAMGVYPYITASIVMQLLVPIIPALERISQEPKGQEKINKWTYWLTIPLAALQGYGQMYMLVNSQQAGGARVLNVGEWNLFSLEYFLPSFTILVSMIAGTMVLIWIGDLITEQGIGNGLSMIIFGGIVARLPTTVGQMMQSGETTVAGWAGVALFLLIGLITIVGIVAIQEGKRDLRVRYSSQVRGTKMYGGARTTLPLKVNMAGMIPLIFAQSFMIFPGTVASYLVPPQNSDPANWTIVQRIATWVSTTLSTTSAAYWILLFVLVMFFTFFYTIVVFSQTNMAKNLQKQGAFIEGLRPGERTDKYLNKIVNRITLVGAVFLAVVAVLPFVVQQATGVQVGLSATGLLIVVGVAVDTMKQLEGQLAIRGYEKFIRR
jgi:preprotein translocase subunit SecY